MIGTSNTNTSTAGTAPGSGLTRRVIFALMALAIAAAAVLVGTQSAEAGSFHERISGNFIDTAVDTNNDGVAGSSWNGVAKGSGGPTYQGVIEVAFEPTGRCATGAEGTLAAYSIVRRYPNGDQLASRLVEGFVCFDPATGLGTVDVEAEIIGGSGRYADASGSYTATFDIHLLLADGTGGIAHGAFMGTTSGTVR